jgi:hypothetical protein
MSVTHFDDHYTHNDSKSYFLLLLNLLWGTRWRSWLRRCATSRKVVGSIPDGVTGIFH